MTIKEQIAKLGYTKIIIYKGGIKRGAKVYEGEPPYKDIPKDIANAPLIGYEIDCRENIMYLEAGKSI